MTDVPELKPCWAALMNYQQADMDGTMVLVSRRAIHECVDDYAIDRNAILEEAAKWFDNEAEADRLLRQGVRYSSKGVAAAIRAMKEAK